MNVLVVGCSQAGLALVRRLEESGCEVSVLDASAENLRQLGGLEGRPFTGVALVGMPIDVDVLRQAGIETCDAVAAVADDDRINIMVAQIARDVFGIQQTVACIADPRLEQIYAEEFGLATLCPTRLTVNAAMDALTGVFAPPARGSTAAAGGRLRFLRKKGRRAGRAKG